jgi:MFS family permease
MRVFGSAAAFTPTLLACYAISFVVHIGTVTLSTLLPFQVIDLGGSKTQVGLLFSVGSIVAMGLRPTVGGLVDRFGARRVTAPGVAILFVTSILFHFATTPVALIVLMLGIGVSSGLISTPASVVSATVAAAEHRGETLGTYYLASSLAIAVSPPLAFGVRAVGGMTLEFVTVTVVALVLAVLLIWLPGAARATLPATGPPRLTLVSRSALPVSGALVLATLGHSSVYAFLPLYAVSRGRGPALAWFFTVYPLLMISCRALLRGVSDRFGHVRVAAAAMVCLTLGFTVLAPAPTPLTLVVAAALMAFGNAVLYPTLVALVVDRAPEAQRGVAVGTLSGSWDLGVVLGSALVGFVADQYSYGAGFVVGGIGTALGAVALVFGTTRVIVLAAIPTR